jgi:tetratricopeptide (TPR) repeat protein
VLAGLPKDARRLLWMITRSEEAVPFALARELWLAESNVGDFDEVLQWLVEADIVAKSDETEEISFHGIVAERAAVWMQTHSDEQGERDEVAILRAMGEWYRQRFYALRANDCITDAIHAGMRSIHLSPMFDVVEAALAQHVATSTADPTLLGQIIEKLGGFVRTATPGRNRWVLRLALADALAQYGSFDQAEMIYQLAEKEAFDGEHWFDCATILIQQGHAARSAGRIDTARQYYRIGLGHCRRAQVPRFMELTAEFELLRLEVFQDNTAKIIPELATKLKEIREIRTKSTTSTARQNNAEDDQIDGIFRGALDVARQASQKLADWKTALDLQLEIENMCELRRPPEHERALRRFSRYDLQLKLALKMEQEGQTDDARRLRIETKDLLMGCEKIFEAKNDQVMQAKTRSAMAQTVHDLGDIKAAIEQERLALALKNAQHDPIARAVSHHNLSSYLHKMGNTDEAALHWQAAFVYRLEAKQAHSLSLSNLCWHKNFSSSCGKNFANLLADDTFIALRQFLEERHVDLATLQATVDEAISIA